MKYAPHPPFSASFYHPTNEWAYMGGASKPSIHRNLHCFHASDVDVDDNNNNDDDGGSGGGGG